MVHGSTVGLWPIGSWVRIDCLKKKVLIKSITYVTFNSPSLHVKHGSVVRLLGCGPYGGGWRSSC